MVIVFLSSQTMEGGTLLGTIQCQRELFKEPEVI